MKKIVVLTGAGMSAESGLSTFRDSGGLWDKYPVEKVATPEGFEENPELVLDFYNERRAELIHAKPNQGHVLLAELEKNFTVSIITQNIDDLHERAGSSHVLHLHGELMKVQSTGDPSLIYELTPENSAIHLGDTCEKGYQLRPFVVWFGEPVPLIEMAVEEVRTADIFVIIGTSLNVYPAAGLLNYVPDGVPVYLIDPKEVRYTGKNHIIPIYKGASEGMRDLILKLAQEYK
ncbi:MAG: NAD-dependent deacylase [Bacteroidales bacterium]|nr:NAD-dependent deacylase [Bacteroidales bacterium]